MGIVTFRDERIIETPDPKIYPHVYEVVINGHTIEDIFTDLEDAEYFVQNHIHEYVEG